MTNQVYCWDDPNLWNPIGCKGGVPISVILRNNYSTFFITKITNLINEISLYQQNNVKWHKKSIVGNDASDIFITKTLYQCSVDSTILGVIKTGNLNEQSTDSEIKRAILQYDKENDEN